jgi:hypothetical protein
MKEESQADISPGVAVETPFEGGEDAVVVTLIEVAEEDRITETWAEEETRTIIEIPHTISTPTE